MRHSGQRPPKAQVAGSLRTGVPCALQPRKRPCPSLSLAHSCCPGGMAWSEAGDTGPNVHGPA